MAILGFIVLVLLALWASGVIFAVLFVAPCFGGGDTTKWDLLAGLIVFVGIWYSVWWACPFTVSMV